ncbi:hypothetical protein [Magnaporthe oryzae narnavirus 1]|uniref:Uncharacterized protein n=1 Tax=Magnaporthe oryzae narnavirus 1 TaxID=2737030 RepID=A0A7I8CZQ6_9VIRU|nr:hypothetical protein [Magnaporthe oryzae narnavirus 1]
MSSTIKQRQKRVLTSIGPTGPTPTELAKWLRSLPQDMFPGEIASVLEKADDQRFEGNRLRRTAVNRPASEPVPRKRLVFPPANPSPEVYERENVPLPRSFDDIPVTEVNADRKPTVRQALILEQLRITDATPEELWTAVQAIPNRCYGHEHGPLLAEVIHRYPDILDIIEISFIDGISASVSKKGDDEQRPVSLELTPLTDPMVHEAIEQAPKSLTLRATEEKAPSGLLHNTVKFNPHGNKVVDDLVFEHDKRRVLEMLDKPKHMRVRVLEDVLRKGPSGPFTITEVGDFIYLHYKEVEIVSLWVGDKPPLEPKRRKSLTARKLRNKEWIEKHRSHCDNGCRHCKRFSRG